MNQIIQLVLRLFIRRGVHKGFEMLTNKQSESQKLNSTPDKSAQVATQANQKRARQALGLLRRFTRF